MTEPKPNSLMAAHQFAIACETVQAVLNVPKTDIQEISRPEHDDWKLYVHLKDGTKREFDLTVEQRRAFRAEGLSRMGRFAKDRP